MTMRPRLPLAMIRRSTARASSSGAVRFVSMILAICSGEVCTCRLSWPIAALLTRASIGPRRLSASLRKALMALTSVTSTDAATTRSGLAAATASSSGVTVRAKAATLAPCARMSSTMARPSPREPPETTTTVAGPMGSVLSDIALQGLLDRDVVQEPHPPGHGVVGEARGAPRGAARRRWPPPRARRRRSRCCRRSGPCGRGRRPRPPRGAPAGRRAPPRRTPWLPRR